MDTFKDVFPDNDDLLQVDYSGLSCLERLQLICKVDVCIDACIEWLGQVRPGEKAYQFLQADVQELRLKRFLIWNSLFPRFKTLIRLCGPVNCSPISTEYSPSISHELL